MPMKLQVKLLADAGNEQQKPLRAKRLCERALKEAVEIKSALPSVVKHVASEYGPKFTDDGWASTFVAVAGGAGGRVKTGQYIPLRGQTATRVGLTVQQVMGVPIGSWGTGANEVSAPIGEIVA